MNCSIAKSFVIPHQLPGGTANALLTDSMQHSAIMAVVPTTVPLIATCLASQEVAL